MLNKFHVYTKSLCVTCELVSYPDLDFPFPGSAAWMYCMLVMQYIQRCKKGRSEYETTNMVQAKTSNQFQLPLDYIDYLGTTSGLPRD